MSQLSKLISSSGSTALIAIIKVIELSFISNNLTDELKGIYALLNLQLLMSVLLSEMGIQNAVYSIGTYTNEMTRSLYWYNFFKSLVFWGLGFLILTLLPIPEEYNQLFYLLNYLILINGVGKIFRSFFLLENNINIVSITELISNAIGVSFTILFIRQLGVIAFVYGLLIKHSIDNSIFFISRFSSIKLIGSIEWRKISKTVKIGFFDMSSQVVNLISKELDTLLVTSFLGLETVGVMNIGKQLILKPIRIISPVFNNLFYSLFAKASKNDRELNTLLSSQLKMNSFITTIGYSLILMLLNLIIDIFFSNTTYTNIQPLLMLFILLGVYRGYWSVLGSFILSKGLTKKAFLFNILYLTVNITLSYLILSIFNELIYIGATILSLLAFQYIAHIKFYIKHIGRKKYYQLTVINSWPLLIILVLKVFQTPLVYFLLFSVVIISIYTYLNFKSLINAYKTYQKG
ncbi:MAG: oligosaccharide flippase family protein [Bacteroidetes bacterium]|nr:oligosaccharide flippase family protein [Bacteroidota bacterium]